jgi:hypothetical protein
MALEGTLQTPIGKVQKKTAVIGVGVAAVLGAIVYYRQQQLGSDEVGGTEALINPATGYPYGSAEDAAALAEQAGFISPPASGGGGGGSGSIPPSNLSYRTNGEWSQAVVEYMVGNGLIEDPSQLSAALGKYLTGQPATSTDQNLIQQAIAVQGFPPLAGPNGYPPSINTATIPTTPPVTPVPKPSVPPVPTGIQVQYVTRTGVALGWPKPAGSTSVRIYATNGTNRVVSGRQSYLYTGLSPNKRYGFQIVANNNVGSSKPSAYIYATTKK